MIGSEVIQAQPDAAATSLFLSWMRIYKLGRKRLLDTMHAAPIAPDYAAEHYASRHNDGTHLIDRHRELSSVGEVEQEGALHY